MPLVFISHATADLNAATEVADRLKALQIGCWMAPRDIAPGQPWPTAIENAIASCGAFVLLLSEHANRSDEVMNEVALAARRRKPIIQLRLRNVEPATGMAYHLSRVQWLDASGGPVAGYIDRLAEAIRGLLDDAGGTDGGSEADLLRQADDHWRAGRYFEANELYRSLALQGNAEAAFNLGHSYYAGEGNDRDDAQAAHWYRKAAEKGHAKAALNLAIFLRDGRGVRVDRDEYFQVLREHAASGDPRILCELALAHERGHGTPRSMARAAELYQRASDLGELRATCNLGTLYLRGSGVPKDLVMGVALTHRAAMGGDVDAQKRMGLLLAAGYGVTADLPKAHYWLVKAIEQGDRDAEDFLSQLQDPKMRAHLPTLAKEIFQPG